MSKASPQPGSQPAARTVPCPTCKRPAVFAPQNPWRPFCTERCRSADLGAWASGAYRLPETHTEGMQPEGPES